MALSLTTRLNLPKFAAGDRDWGTLFSAQQDLADTRLLKVSTDFGSLPDPNGGGGVAGDYVGQLYLDVETVPPRTWYCTTAGVAGVAVWTLPSSGTELSIARGWIDGLETSRVNGTTYGVTAGQATNSANSAYLTLPSAFTKTTGLFSVGTAGGSMSSSLNALGHPNNSTWYFLFLMSGAGLATDLGLDTDITGANLAADHPTYTTRRRIMSIKTDSGASLAYWFQSGDFVLWGTPVQERTMGQAVVSGEQDSFTLTGAPPGMRKMVLLQGFAKAALAADGGVLMYSGLQFPSVSLNPETSSTPPYSNMLLANPAAVDQMVSLVCPVLVDVDNVCYMHGTTGTTPISRNGAVTHGWWDDRGKNG